MTEPSAASSTTFFLRRPEWLAAIVISMAVVAFHLDFLVHAGGFWRDEINLINVAGRSSLREIGGDSFPVLMPLLVKGWSAAGLARSDAGLRMLGLFIGLAAAGTLWLATWTARRSPPLIGLVLFGLNSTVIAFGDSIRSYGLGCVTIALAFAAAIFFVKRPNWPRAGLFAGAAVLSVQALFHNAVLVGAICAGAMSVGIREKNWRAVGQIFLAGSVAAISLAPYFLNFSGSGDELSVLRTGFHWSRFVFDLTNAVGFPWFAFVFVWAVLALAVAGRLAAGLLKRFPPDNMQWFAGTTLLASAAGFVVFLWRSEMPAQPFYFLPVMSVAVICFDCANLMPSRPWQILFSLGAVVTLCLSLPVDKRDLDYRLSNVDIWAKALDAGASRDDYIIVVPWFSGITFAHYYSGPAPWTTLPPLADHVTHRYDLIREEMFATNAVAPVLEKISATLSSGHRVWMLCPPNAMRLPSPDAEPPPDLPPPPLPQTGWWDEPYTETWTAQTVFYLARHGRQFSAVPDPVKESHVAEDMRLFMFEGWRENQTAK